VYPIIPEGGQDNVFINKKKNSTWVHCEALYHRGAGVGLNPEGVPVMSQTQKHARKQRAVSSNFHVSGGIRKGTGVKAPVSYAGKNNTGEE